LAYETDMRSISLTNRILMLGRLLAMAGRAVWAYKLRSIFVAVGVGFGIASLTLIVTSVEGANKMAHQMVDMFGPDAAFVIGGNIEKRAVGMRTLTLSWEDVHRLRQSLPGAYLVVPMRAKGSVDVRYKGQSATGTLVVGASEDYASSWNWPLAEGRDITVQDVERGARICIVGFKPAQELFGEEPALGKVIYMNSIPFQVVGQLSYRGFTGGGGGGDIDNRIIVPLPTLTQRFNMDRKYFRAIRVKFLEPEHMAAHVENLRAFLRHLHGLSEGEDDDFTIFTADEILEFMAMFKGGLVVFLSITATIAVLVGGFVLANLFSISVSERSYEIGLRKALGARNSAVLTQFLMEACLLTLVGGLLGLALGLGLGQLLTRLGILTISFSWNVFFISLASALGVGLLFGLKPARQAALMDPIQALRGGDG